MLTIANITVASYQRNVNISFKTVDRHIENIIHMFSETLTSTRGWLLVDLLRNRLEIVRKIWTCVVWSHGGHARSRTHAPIHGFEESLLLIKSLNVGLTEFTESIMLFQLGFGNILFSAKSTDRSRVGSPDDPQRDPRPKDWRCPPTTVGLRRPTWPSLEPLLSAGHGESETPLPLPG